MKNKILATVSIFALIGMMPAMADTSKSQSQINAEASTSGHITKDAKEAIEKIKSDASEAYEEIKATLIGNKKDDKNIPLVISSQKTASGMIDHNVYNEKHEIVAKVADIILDKDGKAIMIVVVGDKFLGMGKQAAFDFGSVTRVEEDGDVIMPLTEKIIDNAAPFSYDNTDGNDRVRVVPDNGYRVSKLLDGKLVNQKKEIVADIENISFKNGMAETLIIGFDKILGLGGQRAAITYSSATIIRDGEALDFQLSNENEARVNTYKETVMK